MAEDHKPWRAEYAKSARAQCHGCSEKIGKDELRLGKMVPSQHFSGFIPLWFHSGCVFEKRNMIASTEDVDGFDAIRWDDQKKVEMYVNGGEITQNEEEDEEMADKGDDEEGHEAGEEEEDGEAEEDKEDEPGSHEIEISRSARSACKVCQEKILLKSPRVSTKSGGFRHAKCFLEAGLWKKPMEQMPGWENLAEEEQSSVQEIAKPLLEPFIAARKKRQAEAAAAEAEKKLKKQKVDEEKKLKKAMPLAPEDEANELEKKIKRQTKALWAINDALRDNVSVPELKEMLEMNNTALSKSENILRERCADGMLFGPLESCPQCSGPLAYDDGEYRCHGNISEWTRCNYKSPEVKRGSTWRVPRGNSYLQKWSKGQKSMKREARVLRPQAAKASTDDSTSYLKGVQVFFLGELQEKPQGEWTGLIEEAGGVVHESLNSGVTVVVSTQDEISKDDNPLAERMGTIPVVGERYLKDCLEMKKKLPWKEYRLELPRSAVAKVKVKGRSAVHEDSGLEDQGHILEVGKTVYNMTLSMADISRNVNRYYILQIIKEDKGQACFVFRRWGNVGDRGHGGKKLEQFSRQDEAIKDFKSIFLDKTGNEWENREFGFQKITGKYYPVEIDYGVDDVPRKDLAVSDGSRSRLHPRVVSLMRMLFDIETYRAAMLEFEINTAEMPLGKLSKRHIAKGFQILTDVQNILKSNSGDRSTLLLDASNRFYTTIPSVNTSLIGDEEALKTKIQMLEALKDIEIASQIISTGDVDDDTDPLDMHYKKLNCDVVAIPHDSPEFELVKRYLERTHAPTHTDWGLEVEDVFMVRREGEEASYAPMKASLHNKMLLWHGSRTTNFVGILSQGLRIAPPEAPVTGYMFGKGVYFADLVSKSAQYCYTSRSSPVGLMLLSEVAMGDIKEYTQAQYMEKPPAGYNSTKGVGKTAPDPSEFETFEDNIVVPCGRPTASRVHSSLLYNEYIVYSTSQIKLRFLLKVRFTYKR